MGRRARSRAAPPPGDSRVTPLAVLTALGATVTLVSGVIGIVFVLLPQLKPEPPPVQTAAHLRRVSFDRDVTFGQFLARSDQQAGGLARGTLARHGAMLTFHFTIIGYKNRRLPLRWHVIDTSSGDQVGRQDTITIKGTAAHDEGDWPIWVQLPRGHGPFAIVVELINPAGQVPLATLRTPSFPGQLSV